MAVIEKVIKFPKKEPEKRHLPSNNAKVKHSETDDLYAAHLIELARKGKKR